MNSAYWTSNKFSSYQHSHLKIHNFQKIYDMIWYKITRGDQYILMMASEQSHVAIKYQVLVYSEEIEELRMAKWSYCLEK